MHFPRLTAFALTQRLDAKYYMTAMLEANGAFSYSLPGRTAEPGLGLLDSDEEGIIVYYLHRRVARFDADTCPEAVALAFLEAMLQHQADDELAGRV